MHQFCYFHISKCTTSQYGINSWGKLSQLRKLFDAPFKISKTKKRPFLRTMFIAKRKPLRDGNCGHMVSDQTHVCTNTHKFREKFFWNTAFELFPWLSFINLRKVWWASGDKSSFPLENISPGINDPLPRVQRQPSLESPIVISLSIGLPPMINSSLTTLHIKTIFTSDKEKKWIRICSDRNECSKVKQLKTALPLLNISHIGRSLKKLENVETSQGQTLAKIPLWAMFGDQ